MARKIVVVDDVPTASLQPNIEARAPNVRARCPPRKPFAAEDLVARGARTLAPAPP